jgi:hypothetical protein
MEISQWIVLEYVAGDMQLDKAGALGLTSNPGTQQRFTTEERQDTPMQALFEK